MTELAVKKISLRKKLFSKIRYKEPNLNLIEILLNVEL